MARRRTTFSPQIADAQGVRSNRTRVSEPRQPRRGQPCIYYIYDNPQTPTLKVVSGRPRGRLNIRISVVSYFTLFRSVLCTRQAQPFLEPCFGYGHYSSVHHPLHLLFGSSRLWHGADTDAPDRASGDRKISASYCCRGSTTRQLRSRLVARLRPRPVDHIGGNL